MVQVVLRSSCWNDKSDKSMEFAAKALGHTQLFSLQNDSSLLNCSITLGIICTFRTFFTIVLAAWGCLTPTAHFFNHELSSHSFRSQDFNRKASWGKSGHTTSVADKSSYPQPNACNNGDLNSLNPPTFPRIVMNLAVEWHRKKSFSWSFTFFHRDQSFSWRDGHGWSAGLAPDTFVAVGRVELA